MSLVLRILCVAWFGSISHAATEDLFGAEDASYVERIGSRDGGDRRMRIVAVEERVGVERRGALVRVPVFFAEGECREVNELAIVDAGGETRAVQADDVRRGPDGGVSRAHLWFTADLAPWERQTFTLERRAAPPTESLQWTERGDQLVALTNAGEVVFKKQGQHAGALLRAGALASEGLQPSVMLTRGGEVVARLPGETAPDVQWGAGPHFWKLRVRWSTAQALLEQDYRIARDGRIVVSQTLIPHGKEPVTLKEREVLGGKLTEPGASIAAVPTGLRRELRDLHGYTTALWIAPGEQGAGLILPVTAGGASGRATIDDRSLEILAPANLSQKNADVKEGTLRAFWTELQWIPLATADREQAWETYRAHVQPLVAIVDEPGVGRDEYRAALGALIREMKPVGWRQEAARAVALGNTNRGHQILDTKPAPSDADAAALERSARNAWRKLSDNGARRLREDEKARASGPLDPYHITYTHTAAAVLDAMGLAPEKTRQVDRAYARAARQFLGRVDDTGFPYLDCFSRALNMQMGALVFGLVEPSEEDAEIAAFYRDLAGAPAIRAVYGRAQRPYSAKVTTSAEYSDYLYQAVCDYWIRVAELTSGETLELHPLAFARYTDCVDVMADRYHAADPADRDGSAPAPRANFFRAQPHTHRWLGWSVAPFMRLAERPGDFTGATEAIAHCRMLAQRWKNWPDLTYYAIASLLADERFHARERHALLPMPDRVGTESGPGRATVRWEPVPGAVGYRIYRARAGGGGWEWLNSPYREGAKSGGAETEFVDEQARAGDRYFVTTVNRDGRESRWFPDEPLLH